MVCSSGRVAVLAGCLLLTGIGRAGASPLVLGTAVPNTDWESAGVGGVENGNGVITLAGTSGTITVAFLYWHGIDLAGGAYDNPTVFFNGAAVTGTNLGVSGSNAWGPGTSATFRADVSSFVTGNGSYTVSGLSNGVNYSANGASLIVAFDDGIAANNRNLFLFNGNDSNISGFPGDDQGWNATWLIPYTTGAVVAQLHVADGQVFPDAAVTFSTPLGGTFTISDNGALFDGNSVPSAGLSRSEALDFPGNLWDIHTFEISSVFGASGSYALTLNAGLNQDALGLVVAVIDTQADAQGTPVPEPATVVMLLTGLGTLIGTRRFRIT